MPTWVNPVPRDWRRTVTMFTSTDRLTAELFAAHTFIPDCAGHVHDVLNVIRLRVENRAIVSHAAPDVEGGRKARDTALKAFTTAYSRPALSETEAGKLLEATGLRHEQVCQFTREELVTINDTLKGWLKPPTKAEKKAATGAELAEVKAALAALPVDVAQQIAAAGQRGDQFVLTVVSAKEVSVVMNRGGKKTALMANVQTGAATPGKVTDVNAAARNAMSVGRARRIARELTAPGNKYDGNLESLPATELKWIKADGGRRQMVEDAMREYREKLAN